MSHILWRRALPIGVADALIWVWFLQTAYLSRFTEQLPIMGVMSQQAPYLSVVTCIVLSLALMLLRWDAIPAAYRIALSLLGVITPSMLLVLQGAGLGEELPACALYFLFVVAYYGSQILRIETLAKCPDGRTLLMALITSLVAYYALSFVLLLVPLAAYNTIVAAAPLVLLYRTWRPIEPQPDGDKDGKPDWRRIFLSAPTILLVLFGISGGLISAHGGSNPALTLTGLFRMPDPAHLVMVLANMGLGILAARTLRAPRGMYFCFLSVVWMGGSFLGAFIITWLPPIPQIAFMVLAGAVAVAILASFVTKREIWMRAEDSERASTVSEDLPPAASDATEKPADGLRDRPSHDGGKDGFLSTEEEEDPQDIARNLASEAGLTPRETEIFALLAEGRSVPVICNRLVISEGTARTHVKHIYQKLGVHTRQELLDLIKS